MSKYQKHHLYETAYELEAYLELEKKKLIPGTKKCRN